MYVRYLLRVGFTEETPPGASYSGPERQPLAPSASVNNGDIVDNGLLG